ncbi:unnamed protein product [Malus baccata var. baccata]
MNGYDPTGDVTSRPGADHFPGFLHHHSTILSALGLDHALTVLFLGTHKQLPRRSPILGLLWPPSRLTSEFLWNPKPHDIVRFGPRPRPYGFVSGNSRATSQEVTHHEIALAPFSLNFGVSTEPEASELSKGLVLGRDENIHLRITFLGDVRCYRFPKLLEPIENFGNVW